MHRRVGIVKMFYVTERKNSYSRIIQNLYLPAHEHWMRDSPQFIERHPIFKYIQSFFILLVHMAT